jgi:ATP-dependent HslUV protease ATP-binding subunit HslU
MPNTLSPSDLQDFLSDLSSKSGKQIKLVTGSGKQAQRTEKKKVPISEARKRLVQAELDKMISQEYVLEKALESVEQEGIVFIDEIDKIVSSKGFHHGPDASAEGVQRDLLPIIEGSTVSTKYGNVKTDYILFIASGAFHSVKPADMLAELQGRLPVRVDLKALTEEDLIRILTEPEYNLIKQNTELFKTEGVDLQFGEQSVKELAKVSAEINRHIENIGARRLHTVVEKVLEELSFDAAEMAGETVEITSEKVRNSVGDMLKKVDLYRHVL